MDTDQARTKTYQRISEMANTGDRTLNESDHRHLSSAVPLTIGDQQTAMALLGFFDKVSRFEHKPNLRFRFMAQLSQLGLVTFLGQATKWIR